MSERQARQFNLDQTRTYTLSELVEIFKAEDPQSNIDESMIAGKLGLGAALNPQAGDLLFYEKYALAYKSYLDSQPGQKGFVEWEPFDHPTLGSVEIGGFVPYLSTTPPYEWTDSLLNLQVPWILKLAGELPDIHLYEIKTSARGNGIYQLDIWIENRAFIPFPTDMGSRNRQPAPAVLTLEGEQVEFISGYRRTPISRVGGKSRVKTTLIIQMEKPGNITLKLESKTAGHDLQTIKIGG